MNANMDVLISGFNSQIFTHLNRFLIQGCLFIQTQNYLTLSFSYIRFRLMFTPSPDCLQISASAKYSPLPSLLMIVCRYPLQLNITPPTSTGRLHEYTSSMCCSLRSRSQAFGLRLVAGVSTNSIAPSYIVDSSIKWYSTLPPSF